MRDAGYRVILPDLAGFGRSDKPTDFGWYSYDRHTEYAATLFEDLDLRDATVVVHDWGGPIGLRIAIEQPERVGRMVLMDTGLFTGLQHMSDAWKMFRDFVERTEDLPISMLVRSAVQDRSWRRGGRRLRRALPRAEGEAGDARVPADAAHGADARRAPRRGRGCSPR